MIDEKIILPFQDSDALQKIAEQAPDLNLQSGKTIIDRTYLEKMAMDKDGNITDPFGNPYNYDTRLGKISSATPNYSGW